MESCFFRDHTYFFFRLCKQYCSLFKRCCIRNSTGVTCRYSLNRFNAVLFTDRCSSCDLFQRNGILILQIHILHHKSQPCLRRCFLFSGFFRRQNGAFSYSRSHNICIRAEVASSQGISCFCISIICPISFKTSFCQKNLCLKKPEMTKTMI